MTASLATKYGDRGSEFAAEGNCFAANYFYTAAAELLLEKTNNGSLHESYRDTVSVYLQKALEVAQLGSSSSIGDMETAELKLEEAKVLYDHGLDLEMSFRMPEAIATYSEALKVCIDTIMNMEDVLLMIKLNKVAEDASARKRALAAMGYTTEPSNNSCNSSGGDQQRSIIDTAGQSSSWMETLTSGFRNMFSYDVKPVKPDFSDKKQKQQQKARLSYDPQDFADYAESKWLLHNRFSTPATNATSFVQKSVLTSISGALAKQRLLLATELLTTELSHVKNLEVIQKIFCAPLRIAGIVDASFLEKVFSNIDELVELHRFVAVSLRCCLQRASTADEIQCNLSRTLLDLLDGAKGQELTTAISSFCQGQRTGVDALVVMLEENVKLKAFIETAENGHVCQRRKLRDFLGVESQRIAKYPLLLEKLVCSSTPGSSEHQKLELVLQKSKQLLLEVDRSATIAEDGTKKQRLLEAIDLGEFVHNIDRVPSSVKSLANGAILDSKRVIHTGPVTVRVQSIKRGVEELVSTVAVLTTDMLLLLIEERRENKDYSLQLKPFLCSVQFCPAINLRNVQLRPCANDHQTFFVLNTTECSSQLLQLIVENGRERKTWMDAIGRQMLAILASDDDVVVKLRKPISSGMKNMLEPIFTSSTEEELEEQRSTKSLSSCTVLEQCYRNRLTELDNEIEDMLNGAFMKAAIAATSNIEEPIREVLITCLNKISGYPSKSSNILTDQTRDRLVSVSGSLPNTETSLTSGPNPVGSILAGHVTLLVKILNQIVLRNSECTSSRSSTSEATSADYTLAIARELESRTSEKAKVLKVVEDLLAKERPASLVESSVIDADDAADLLSISVAKIKVVNEKIVAIKSTSTNELFELDPFLWKAIGELCGQVLNRFLDLILTLNQLASVTISWSRNQ